MVRQSLATAVSGRWEGEVMEPVGRHARSRHLEPCARVPAALIVPLVISAHIPD